MSDRVELEQNFSSPFKSTKLYIKGGRAFFGLWRPPEVRLDGDEEQLIIEQGNEGQLDLVAQQVYGDRALWYVIAHANQINFPLRDLPSGRRIVIPKLANVNAALLAARGRQQQAVT